MDTLRLLGFALAFVASFGACAKSKGGQTGDEDALPGGERFFGALGSSGGAADYAPAGSVAELVAASERVVVGRAVALRAGRTYVETTRQSEDEIRMHTAVLEIEVERTLKGPERASLYLEFVVGAEDVAPPERLPESRVVAFAVENGRGWSDSDTIEDEGSGLPAGETLFRLTNPDSLAIASADDRSVTSIAADATVFGSGDLEGDAGGGEQDGGPAERDAGVTAPSDAGSCFREYPTGPGADPVPCPSECFAVQASPFDATNGCVDFETLDLLGCLDGAAPPVVVCVERVSDGQRFLVRSAWPFGSEGYHRPCADDVSSTVLSAPECM